MIAPAKTGSDNNKRKAVIKTDQQYNGISNNDIPRQRINNMVTIKFIAPAIDETPAMCKLNIAKSTDGPGCPKLLDNGG